MTRFPPDLEPPAVDGAMSTQPAGAHDASVPQRERMSTLDFALTLEQLEDGTTVLVLAGELDLYRAREIEEALAHAIEGPDVARSLTVDLRSVTFLDSTALAILLDATRRQQARGSELIVLVGLRTPTTAFEVTGFDRLLSIRHVGMAATERPA